MELNWDVVGSNVSTVCEQRIRLKENSASGKFHRTPSPQALDLQSEGGIKRLVSSRRNIERKNEINSHRQIIT